MTTVGVPELTAALKRSLKERGMTYAALARSLGLSEASVKRIFSERSFTLERVESICRVLGIDLYELARLARGQAAVESVAAPVHPDLATERVLAADPKLLLAYHLRLDGWSEEEALAAYAFSTAEWRRAAARLESLGLAGRRVAWREGGPVRRALHRLAQGESFAVELVKRKLERVSAELRELAEIDALALFTRYRRTAG